MGGNLLRRKEEKVAVDGTESQRGLRRERRGTERERVEGVEFGASTRLVVEESFFADLKIFC